MADAAISALFDDAQDHRYKNHPLTCCDCGVVCARASGRQKRCPDCSREHNLSERRKRAREKFGHTNIIGGLFICAKCKKETVRGHACEKYCIACRTPAKKEKKKAARPVPTVRICQRCCAVVLERQRKKFCFECAEMHKKEREAAWRADNAEKLKRDKAEYHAKNAEKIIERVKEWQKENPDRVREWGEERRKDPVYRLRHAMSNGIRDSLKKGKSGRSWETLVDYTLPDLRKHLESAFLPGMSWGNYGKGEGKWNVDHIVPVSSFDCDTPDHPDFKVCWALTNLRPLWSIENSKKGAKRLFLV